MVLTGGRGREGTVEGGGWFYEPTVLSNVRDGSLVLEEETFGPVVAIVPVSGEEEAVRRAQETRAGLSASVWTRDERSGERIARRLEVGSVFVNDVRCPRARASRLEAEPSSRATAAPVDARGCSR